MQYLTFLLEKEFYGVSIDVVREINRVSEITPVPRAPKYIKGVMNLRGRIIPVISLRLKFDMSEKLFDRDTCIIVIDGATGQIGVMVDSVKEVVDLSDQQIESAPQMGSASQTEYIKGMGKTEDKVIILVDVIKALSEKNLDEIKKINEDSEHVA